MDDPGASSSEAPVPSAAAAAAAATSTTAVKDGIVVPSQDGEAVFSPSSLADRATAFEKKTRAFAQASCCSEDTDVENATVDFDRVRELGFEGVPDTALMRGVYWRLLLGFLPPKRLDWEREVLEKRKLYAEFVRDLTVDPTQNEDRGDHPLSSSEDSSWLSYFKDSEIIWEVDKDVKRTLPHLHFFNSDPKTGSTEHYEGLKRILFVYAKLNPGIRYVQGMNEILGPLYYVVVAPGERQLRHQQLMSNETSGINAAGVGSAAAALLFPESKDGDIGGCEADAFFCFTGLMAEIRDNFCKTLDRSDSGVQGSIRRFEALLKRMDIEVWTHLERQSINPQFYSFRWITLLLSQEFDLPDVLRLWDSLFSDENRFEFFYYVCVAMLSCIREEILDGDFSSNLKTLQNYPLPDINVIIKRGRDIRAGMWKPPPFRVGYQPLADEATRSYKVAGDQDNRRRGQPQPKKKAETNYSSWGSTLTSLFGGALPAHRGQPPKPSTSSAPSNVANTRKPSVKSDPRPASALKAKATPSMDLFGASPTTAHPFSESRPQPAVASLASTSASSASTGDSTKSEAPEKEEITPPPAEEVKYKSHPLEALLG